MTTRHMHTALPLAFALAVGGSQGTAWPGEARPEVRKIAASNSAFALDLYGALRGSEGNLFVSPYSVSAALAMTCAGAGGNTAAEMSRVLRFDLPEEALHAAFGELMAELKPSTLHPRWPEDPDAGRKTYELVAANSLWCQAGFSFEKDFLVTLRKHYGAGFQEADFRRNPEAARKRINAWVEETTREKIKEILSKGQISELTRLVLANAVYFQSPWEEPFSEAGTKDAPFHLASGSIAQVPTMHQTESFPCMEAATFRGVELAYLGRDLSMLILVPKEAGGLPELERALNAESLERWRTSMGRRELRLSLPKFRFSSTFELSKTLEAMGMKDAFDERRADFSRMTGAPDLFIKVVAHKAFVAVDEKGTEAAAATAVVMDLRGLPPEPVPFRVDRPFLFLIRDNRTGTILFLGRVLDPRAKGS